MILDLDATTFSKQLLDWKCMLENDTVLVSPKTKFYRHRIYFLNGIKM